MTMLSHDSPDLLNIPQTPDTKATPPFVYLAAPGFHPDPEVNRYRYQAASYASSQLTAQGESVYCPLILSRAWSPQYVNKPPADRFAQARAAFMQLCDRFTVLQLPGWTTCPELDADLKIAAQCNLTPTHIAIKESLVPTRWMPNLLPGVTLPNHEEEIGPGIFQITTKTYQAIVQTSEGDLTFELHRDTAPQTVDNFIHQARDMAFYRDNQFHIIIPDLMMQAGKPDGKRAPAPDYALPQPEKVDKPYVRGTLAMHTEGDQISACQFFVVCGEQITLPPRYPIFGTLVDGSQTLEQLAKAPMSDNGRSVQPAERVAISDVRIVEQDAVQIVPRLEPPSESETSQRGKTRQRKAAGNAK